MKFSTYLQLLASGWYPGRRSGLRDLALPPGLEITKAAREFLRKFGGLCVNTLRGVEVEFRPMAVGEDSRWIPDVDRDQGLCPVGRIHDEVSCPILVAADGSLWCLFSPPFEHGPFTEQLGDNVHEALDRVIHHF